jgi:hypothetical protein
MPEDYTTQVVSLLEALQGERLEVLNMTTEKLGKSGNIQETTITFRDLAIPPKKVPKTTAKPSKNKDKPPGKALSKVSTKSKKVQKITQKQHEIVPVNDKPPAPFTPEMADMIQL